MSALIPLWLQQVWLSGEARIKKYNFGLVPYNHFAGKLKMPVIEINVLTLRISCHAFELLAGIIRGRERVKIRLMDSATKPNLEMMFIDLVFPL